MTAQTANTANTKADYTTQDASIDLLVAFWIKGQSEEAQGVVTKLNKKSIRVKTEDGTEHTLKDGTWEPATPDSERGMAGTLSKYREQYVPTVAASGRKSLSNGDELAQTLEYKDHVVVMKIAETVLGLEAGFLATKYEKLNNGAKRMNSGNRIRAAIKRGDITIEDVKAAI